MRNLKHVSRTRLMVWCVLGISSVPLHLVYADPAWAMTTPCTGANPGRYNSAIFPSLPSNSYLWAVVTPSFLSGGYWSASAFEATLTGHANTTV